MWVQNSNYANYLFDIIFVNIFKLSPNDRKILEDFKTDLSEAKTFAKKINAIISAEKQMEEQMAAEDDKKRQYVTNQKLGLISALFKVGDWTNAKAMIEQLPEYYAVSFDIIAKQLCDLTHFVIDKIYRQ